MSDTVSSVILKTLKAHGMRYVFGLPAAQFAVLMDGVSKDPFFTFLTTRHEEACGHMAHAISKITDTMGVCFGTVGPGAANMVAGVAAAYADNIPMLVLTPNNQFNLIEPYRDLLQGLDQVELYKPITKWNAMVRSPERLPELLARAIHIAKSGRPGPVHLDIPCDIGTAAAHFSLEWNINETSRPSVEEEQLAIVCEKLANSKRPVLVAGGGVVRAGATEAFRALVDLTGFPATTTMHARGVIPEDSPSHVGSGGVMGGDAVLKAVAEADLILAIGCKFSSWTPINKPPVYPVPENQEIIQVDIDVEQLGKNCPISMGIVSDAGLFLNAALACLQSKKLHCDPDWLPTLKSTYETYRQDIMAVADARYLEETKVLNEAAVTREIAKLAPEGSILVFDGGQTVEWAHSFLHPSHPENYLYNPGMGHLGTGIPFANAAKLSNPDKTVICVTGDGATGCTVQELETAARYGLNVIIVVLNDSHWGMYQPMGEMIFNNMNFGTKLSDVNFAKVAEGFGCHGEQVGNLDDLGAAFDRALNAGKPALLDVKVGYTPHPMDHFWPTVVAQGMALEPVEI